MSKPSPLPHSPLPRVVQLTGQPFLGHLREYRKDRIAFQHRVAERADVVHFRVGLFPVTMISSPELAHDVLVAHADAFIKSLGLSLFARPLLGNGLLTSEQDFHKKQRRMIAPVFVQKRIAAYADIMSQRTKASAMRMREAKEVDISAEAMRLTLEIVGKTLFDSEMGFEASDIGSALTLAMEQMLHNMMAIVPIPPQVPTPGNLRARKSIARLDQTIFRLIEQRRASGDDPGDLLGLLLAARDDEDQSSMDDVQVRDEVMTIFLAGHETTANAVAWALSLLAKHPSVRQELESEVDRVLGKRAATYNDLKSLPFALQVLKETMRLYPPAYVLGRKALRDVNLAGLRIKKNDIVLINIAGIHRLPHLYENPQKFDPHRFTSEREKVIPRQGYMPFGAGPRICIGNHFALMEGQLLLATYAQHVRLDLQSGVELNTDPLVTLRPKGALMAHVSPRG